MAPLVSVIMPCRNAGPMLHPALSSVIAQNYPNIEIIFVDDASDDGSRAVAGEFAGRSSRNIVIAAAEAQGVNPARIHGLTLARGDYIQWLDADDEIAPDKIALQVTALETQPDMDIAYGDWSVRVHKPGSATREVRRRVQAEPDQIRRTLSLVWHPPNMFLLRRRAADLLAAEQAWWPDRNVATDVEYFAIAALLGLRFAQVPNALAYYNIWSEQQIGSSTPYSTRAATLKDIYARLGAFAGRPAIRQRLTREHHELLALNWDLWAVPRGSIAHEKRDGDTVMLTSRRTGEALEVPQRAAILMQLIEADGAARFLAHHAAETMGRAPSLYVDQAEILLQLEQFRRAGLLSRVVPSAPADEVHWTSAAAPTKAV